MTFVSFLNLFFPQAPIINEWISAFELICPKCEKIVGTVKRDGFSSDFFTKDKYPICKHCGKSSFDEFEKKYFRARLVKTGGFFSRYTTEREEQK